MRDAAPGADLIRLDPLEPFEGPAAGRAKTHPLPQTDVVEMDSVQVVVVEGLVHDGGLIAADLGTGQADEKMVCLLDPFSFDVQGRDPRVLVKKGGFEAFLAAAEPGVDLDFPAASFLGQ